MNFLRRFPRAVARMTTASSSANSENTWRHAPHGDPAFDVTTASAPNSRSPSEKPPSGPMRAVILRPLSVAIASSGGAIAARSSQKTMVFDIGPIIAAMRQTAPEKPVATVLLGGGPEENRDWTAAAQSAGAATFPDLSRAMRALAALADYRAAQEKR